ncbi:MAG: hypothetical protein JO122_05385 [Acetobacteraceae bacterium]|nr:hypothetical protein [Acetobacteraceae bacterium]
MDVPADYIINFSNLRYYLWNAVTVNDRHHFDGNINIQPGVVDFSVLVAKVDATASDFQLLDARAVQRQWRR